MLKMFENEYTAQRMFCGLRLKVTNPAVKTLVDIAKSQDVEIGDGTTSVTLLACEFMTVSNV